jgi:hypothetical protein
MSEESEGLKRRLAAILASDIAGCSRLIGRNEEKSVREPKRVRRRVSAKKDRLSTQKRALCCSTRNVVNGSILIRSPVVEE